MIYPSDFEVKIGFDRIRRQIEAGCITRRAKELAAEAGFVTVYAALEQAIARTDEMRVLLMMENNFPQEGFVDLGYLLKKTEVIGSFLEKEELVVIRRGLVALGELIAFFRAKEEGGLYPRLRELLAGINAFPQIVRQIDGIVDTHGNIRDNASPELQDIRRTMRDRQGQISKRLQQIMREGQSAGYIETEASVSIRDGRAVIPVSAANKRKLKGFVHDESGTGKTFYIEPLEIVEINNELKELEYAERREIVKILVRFTDELRPRAEELASAGEFLAEVDFLRAKARWALANDCVKPILVATPQIALHTARHPLLAQTLAKEQKKVVPLDLTLTPEKHILIISGPNAGGKSVCLKTTGLLQYMLQCGLLVPASENSEMGVFRDIFMDMGDEQSIDNDLSTYSSHLLNMKTMLRGASAHSLVLIDEFGSGTEPAMGGAIAEAVLQQLENKGVFGVITTHYSNLKYYAAGAKGILNGAMAFDVQQIRPLFRLEMGKPGSSFAMEIARKIGLPEEILQSAAEKVGSEQINLERQLREIARDKRYWEGKRDRIRLAEKRTDELAERYERELSELREQHNKLIREAKDEARRLVDEANRRVENTIREIRESQAEKEKTRAVRAELEAFKDKLFGEQLAESEKLDRKMEQLRQREERRAERKERRGEPAAGKPDGEAPAKRDQELAVGDKVRIEGQTAIGEVMEVASNKAVIAFGQIRTTIDKKRLEVISNNEYRQRVKEHRSQNAILTNYDTSKRRLDFRQQIDLRGERAADALDIVRDYVDEAIMLGISEVRILHGKGTGALKEEIRKYLKTVPEVVEAVDEHVDFGGAGITVVRLND